MCVIVFRIEINIEGPFNTRRVNLLALAKLSVHGHIYTQVPKRKCMWSGTWGNSNALAYKGTLYRPRV